MEPADREWLDKHRATLIRQGVPTLEILDMLVVRGMFMPYSDDYEHIRSQQTLHTQLQALLDALPNKGTRAVAIFKEVLQKVCPHVFSTCIDPVSNVSLESCTISRSGQFIIGKLNKSKMCFLLRSCQRLTSCVRRVPLRM